MQPDTSNTIFQQAVTFVTQTNRSLFLTGKAGTGKTTFLRYIRDNCFKKSVIVAPTGVAAINAGGVTIHSFFQLPFGMFMPAHRSTWGGGDSNIYNKNQLLGKLRINAAKRELIQELDLLIIDEVSMVRADLLDAVDTVLRSVRRRHYEPFGGVQMLYIGDLFQLPPVVKNTEQDLFHEVYNSPFFFDAKAVRELPPVYLELKKIYRQRDAKFIQLLNNIRNNCCTDDDLSYLHRYYKPDFLPSREEGYITLTTHNYKADAINREQLTRLPGRVYKHEAEIQGDFPESAYPAPRTLQLKEGAQVMFIKNDKGEIRRYYNGKIGLVQRIDEKKKKIFISFPHESGLLELPLETWSNIRYQYEQDKDEITEEELGTFTQYPVRLAWAVTIHKSQGLTFDKAIIDAGFSFAPGQVYVALSRLTGLEGLVLCSRITPENILTNAQVLAFSHNEQPEEMLSKTLELAQQDFLRQSLLDAFDWKKLMEKADQFIQNSLKRSIPGKPEEMAWLNRLKETILGQYEIAEKFKVQLEKLLHQWDISGYAMLHERTMKAAEWFTTSLKEKCIDLLQSHITELKIKSRAKKYIRELKELLLVFSRKEYQIRQTTVVTDALCQSQETNVLMECVAAIHRPADVSSAGDIAPPGKPEKGATRRISLQLFLEGKSIEEIAAARGLTKGTVEGHLATFIPTGEVEIHQLVIPEKVKEIMAALQKDPAAKTSAIREVLGANFSYGEIRAVILYRQRENNKEKSTG
jgi:hypothetical protein